jgi:hypothetical protein
LKVSSASLLPNPGPELIERALAAFFRILDKDSLEYVIVYGLFPEPFSQAMCSRKT